MEITCPEEESLADYIEGRLLNEERSQIEEHFSDCKRCLDELLVIKSLIRDTDYFELDPVPDKITESAVHLVCSESTIPFNSLKYRLKRSIKHIGSRISAALWKKPWGTWSLAPVRGSKTMISEDLVCLRVPFKEVKTQIEIEKTGGKKAQIRVKLSEANKSRNPIRVTLKRDEREITSHLIENAHAVFEDIPFGHYSISMIRNGLNLGTYLFEIKETNHGKR